MVVGSSQEYNGSMVNYVPKYLRVYLVDDHDIVRQGLRDLLVPAIDIYVVGDSGSAREAARAIPGLAIDVMVLDLRLQDGTGIDVCRAVRAADPSVPGLPLTSSGAAEALAAAILAPAVGIYVVGDSGSAREAAGAVPGLAFGVMVLDVRLQDGRGIDVCGAVRAADPSVHGLLLTSSGDEEALAAAILAGAAGFVVKL